MVEPPGNRGHSVPGLHKSDRTEGGVGPDFAESTADDVVGSGSDTEEEPAATAVAASDTLVEGEPGGQC